ncbi:hypothetical protein EV200_108139 [Pedobacter psychrotolerans]|uniref:Uncharacterized protein n=1 Tax=Pedobacter psychrotolerans TaxID=1843235 RepID=A0A4R2H6M3_9SPHI|nr:hypothetical protein EV200_108139 [Pedobacter psychrotolerans]
MPKPLLAVRKGAFLFFKKPTVYPLIHELCGLNNRCMPLNEIILIFNLKDLIIL